MTATTFNGAHQHFSGTAVGDVAFPRAVSQLILTTTGTVNISFDGGNNFMAITAGTYNFNYIWVKALFFTGSGTWQGCGIAV